VSNLNDNLIQKYDEKKAAEAARKKELATERKRKREAEETEALAVKKGQVEAAVNMLASSPSPPHTHPPPLFVVLGGLGLGLTSNSA